ncbi:ankyrin repeat domain-containing protein [Endozoicomonas sp. ISHI1]|uniref:ankyrin repeat domain-containing protein n=1 Tax=Endozoicomonas sp. ISHI1 TaxID=2825882 RepID=UPI002147B6C1|nr:ankyrin repeat domain-containing protein [Endozoicomonas sp. ISHI1]
MIKHSLFAAPLLLMTLSVVYQAQALTKCFVVELEQKAGAPNQNFSITPDLHTLPGTFSDIADTEGCAGSGLPSDEKQVRLNGCELKKTLIESISWQWLYTTHLLVGYQLILTTKNTPLSSTFYSWLPPEVVVAVGWLLKSYCNTEPQSFNIIIQKELHQFHPLAAIITMPGSGNTRQQCSPSDSSGQQARAANVEPTGSFNSFLYSDSADGSGGSQQHQHTLGLDCFVFPCHGVCQFRPLSDSSEPAEWPMNPTENLTGHTDATPEQNSCPHLNNGHCSECPGHVTDTDVLPMNGIAHPAVPMDTDTALESDPCPICLVHFHDRDETLVIVKSQCCRHRFDLDCISRCFVDQSIGSRRCAMCRQDPMPMLNENTGESHSDTFFPDQAFYRGCFRGDLDQLEKSLAEGVNVNAALDDFTALMLASILGHKDIVERLINAGANLNARNKNGATALFMAAQENNTDCVKILIEAKADLNARTMDGATPLLIAAKKGHTDIVKLLIEAKADLNARIKDGATALFIAAQRGRTVIVKILIEAKADLNARTKDDATPLFIATQKGYTLIVRLLIKAKADLNARTTRGVNSLYIAAQNGHTDIVKALIEAGADLNARTTVGVTSLYITAQNGYTNILELLIEARADLNACSENGVTPLFIAAENGNTDCVKALINAGANVNAVRTLGDASPLFIAAQKGYTDILKLLIEAKADLNARTTSGATPLLVAAYNGHTDIVKLLIEARADLNACDENGINSLFIAAERGNTDCVKALINAGANVNAFRTLDGASPLFIAAQKDYADIVKLLINAGADLNARTSSGATPLLVAAYNGHTDIVKLLINAGADLNTSRTPDGTTPLFIAARKGHTDIVKLLINVGADLNTSRNPDGATPLFIAALKGNNDCVEALIEAGAE